MGNRTQALLSSLSDFSTRSPSSCSIIKAGSSCEAFRVVGMSLDVSIEDLSGVPALWQNFAAREAEVPTPTPGVGYGVSYNSTEEGTFTYMAGVAGSDDIQESTCANCQHRRAN